MIIFHFWSITKYFPAKWCYWVDNPWNIFAAIGTKFFSTAHHHKWIKTKRNNVCEQTGYSFLLQQQQTHFPNFNQHSKVVKMHLFRCIDPQKQRKALVVWYVEHFMVLIINDWNWKIHKDILETNKTSRSETFFFRIPQLSVVY